MFEVACCMVLGEHLPPEHQSFADPLTAAKIGIDEEVRKVHATVFNTTTSTETSRGWLGRLWGAAPWVPKNISQGEHAEDDSVQLDTKLVEKRTKRHARMLLMYARSSVVDFMHTDVGKSVAQAAAARLYCKACDDGLLIQSFKRSCGGMYELLYCDLLSQYTDVSSN